jgi:hypothetical protein
MNWKEVEEQLHIPEQWLNNLWAIHVSHHVYSNISDNYPIRYQPSLWETVLQIILSLQKQYQRIDSQNMSITKRLLSNFDSCNLFVKLRSVATE